jgi:hypothetical protein
MPTRKLPDGSSERVPLADDRAGYTATADDVATIVGFYHTYEYAERPQWLAPDGWTQKRRENRAPLVWIAISPYGTDRVVEVTFRHGANGDPVDHQVSAMSADDAYALALDLDDEAWTRGFPVYNDRHPRPAAKP